MPIPSIDEDYEYVALPPEERARIVIQRLEQMERERFTRKVEEALTSAAPFTLPDPFPTPEAPVIPEDTPAEVVEQIEAQHAEQVAAVEEQKRADTEAREMAAQAEDAKLEKAKVIFEEVRVKPETPQE